MGGLFRLRDLGFPSDVPILISTSVALPFLFYNDLDLLAVRVVDISTVVSVSVGIITIARVFSSVIKLLGDEEGIPGEQLIIKVYYGNQFSRNCFNIANGDIRLGSWNFRLLSPP